MKSEVVFDRVRTSHTRLNDEVLAGHAELRKAMAARSHLLWGEHCAECAYPACYSNCAFYTPRKDEQCRRFERGFEPLDQAPDFKQITFRKWGKVEAKGPPRAFASDVPEVSGGERFVRRALGAPFMPRLIGQRWAYRLRYSEIVRRRPDRAEDFDAFVLETISADGREHDLTLTILNSDQAEARLFQAIVRAGIGYSRLVIPIDRIAAHVDLSASYLVQIEPLNEAEGRALVFGLCDFVRWSGAPLAAAPAMRTEPAASPAAAKVVVWDLDETLWRGTLAEDGILGLRIRPEAVAAIVELDARGVLQSVASKNDPDEALKALAHFGLDEYLLCPQIGWEPKSSAIGRIAQALNLSVESFVFIDDQPFERAEVLNAHPQIRVLDHEQAAVLAGMACFQAPATEESRARRRAYQAEAQREAEMSASGSDYRAFLAASGMTLTVEGLTNANCARVYELSQRTNQLNFNGRKYVESEVRALRATPDVLPVAMRCADRYGDYGLIGFAEIDLEAGRVGQFFMSCRVQKKRVEQAFFEWLRAQMMACGAPMMRVDYTPSDRNAASRAMLERLGFTSDGDGAWSRTLSAPFEDAELVRVDERLGRPSGAKRAGDSPGWKTVVGSTSRHLGGLAICLGAISALC